MRRILPLLMLLALSACGGGHHLSRYSVNSGSSSLHPGITCAPFARELSGLALYGDAYTWWDQADGRYDKDSRPEVGAALVFRRSGRLPSGHVAVVSRILGPRQIQVFQANWVPSEVQQDELVVDVSEDNDWTAVRVWYPPTDTLGVTTYDTYGFVLPPREATHEELARASRPAALYAVNMRGRPLPRARTFGG